MWRASSSILAFSCLALQAGVPPQMLCDSERRIPGAVAWYDVGSGDLTLNGSGISQLNDRTGLGHHLTNGVAANQPLLSRSDNKGNLLKQSESFNTTWVRSAINAFGVTDTGAAGAGSFANTTRTTDPLGGNAADFIQEDSTATTIHYLQIGPSVASGFVRFSVCVKPAGRDWIRLVIAGGSDTLGGYINTSNGSLGSVSNGGGATGAAVTAVSLGNGWFLCTLSGNMTAITTQVSIRSATADGGQSYSGDNTSGLYLWGASLVPSTYDQVTGPTAGQGYIATTTTPVYAGQNGRAIAVFDGVSQYLKTVNFTWNQPETVVWCGNQVTWTDDDTLYDGSINDTLRAYQTGVSPKIFCYAGAGPVGQISLSLGTFGVINNCFNGSSSSIKLNLASAVTGNAGNNNGSGFTLGKYGASSAGFANVNVAEVLLYARALTSTEQTYAACLMDRKFNLGF